MTMDGATVIRRLSFTDARSSPAEAIVFMAKYNLRLLAQAAAGASAGRHAAEADAEAKAADRRLLDRTV